MDGLRGGSNGIPNQLEVSSNSSSQNISLSSPDTSKGSEQAKSAFDTLRDTLPKVGATVKNRASQFFSDLHQTIDRIGAAVGRIFPFLKPTSPEQQHDKAVKFAQKHGVEAGFKRDPLNKAWQRDPEVAAFKQDVKHFCKDQFRMEEGTSSDMAHHELWSNVKSAAEKGDFTLLKEELGKHPELREEFGKINSQFEQKLEYCEGLRDDALNTFVKSMEPKNTVKTIAVQDMGYDKETFLSPEGRVKVSEVGVTDLGATKSPDDSDYSKKGERYCQDKTAIHAFEGGVAVTTSDGVSSAKDSEQIAELATTKLNQKLAENAPELALLYGKGQSAEIETKVKELFVEVQKEIYSSMAENGDNLNAATTAVAFVKIDVPGTDQTLIIGGSLGDCCAAMTTLGKDGPQVELLNPQALDPSIRKQPPVFHFRSSDNQEEQLGKVQSNTHVFARMVPKDAILESFSDGTADSLATTTPVLNEANKFLEGLLPPPNRAFTNLYKMDQQRVEAFKAAIHELVQSTTGTTIDKADPSLPFVQDAEAALASLDKPLEFLGLKDNQAVHKAFMSLSKRDMEQSLEAIYSNPHLNEISLERPPEKEFDYGIPRHEAIRSLKISGFEPGQEQLSLAEAAGRKGNLLHVLTEPLRQAQGPNYRLLAVSAGSSRSQDGKFVLLDETPANQQLLSDLANSYALIKKYDHNLKEIDFSSIRSENGKIYLPIELMSLKPKIVEDALGVKVDDVSNGVIKA